MQENMTKENMIKENMIKENTAGENTDSGKIINKTITSEKNFYIHNRDLVCDKKGDANYYRTTSYLISPDKNTGFKIEYTEDFMVGDKAFTMFHLHNGKEMSLPQSVIYWIPTEEDRLYVPYKVKVVQENGMVRAVFYSRNVYLKNYYYKCYGKIHIYTVTFNCRTGRSYSFPMIIMDPRTGTRKTCDHMQCLAADGGNLRFPESDWFLGVSDLHKIKDYILSLILDEKEKMYGFRPAVYEKKDHYTGNRSAQIYNLISVNDNPLCNVLVDLQGYISTQKFRRLFPRNADDQVSRFFDFIHFKQNKGLNKLLFSDGVSAIFRYMNLYYNYGIRKADNLINYAKKSGLVDEYYMKQFYHKKANLILKTDSSYLKPFDASWYMRGYFQFLREHGMDETTACKRFESLPSKFEYADTIRMLMTIRENSMEAAVIHQIHREGLRYTVKNRKEYYKCLPFQNDKEKMQWVDKILQKGDFIKRVHDEASEIYNLLFVKNEKIPLNDRELNLEKKIKDYEFVCPKDTRELCNVGRKMENCVATYGEKALEKQCLIVVLYRHKVPVVCMELEPFVNNFLVRQVKGIGNRLLADESKEHALVYRWLKEHRLICCTTDFNGPLNEDFPRIDFQRRDEIPFI